MRVVLSTAGVEALHAPVRGDGEFERLIRRFRGQIQGNMLMVAAPDWAKVKAYAEEASDAAVRERAAALLERATIS